MNRRAFVRTSALSLGIPPLMGAAQRAEVGPGGRGHLQDLPSLEGWTIINGLGGISNPNLRTVGDTAASGPLPERPGLDPRAVADAAASGLSAVNVTLGYVSGSMEPFEHTVTDIARWNRWVREDELLLKVWTAADVTGARDEGRVGVIFGFQNSAVVGDDLDRIDTFADLGVRVIQLTYNVRNQVGDGSMVEENRGLTPFGFQILERLQERRVLVDLSHSGETTCLDAVRAATGPIAITHTGCRAVTDLPRNKTDRELRLVAEGGGVVGIYFMPFLHPRGQAAAEDVVRHVEHALQVCGEDHVGIGTDGGTTQVDDMEAYRAVIREEVRQRAAAGIGARGESADVVPMVPDLQGPTQFRKLAGLLRARGHGWTVIEKVLGGNFLRLMAQVWGD